MYGITTQTYQHKVSLQLDCISAEAIIQKPYLTIEYRFHSKTPFLETNLSQLTTKCVIEQSEIIRNNNDSTVNSQINLPSGIEYVLFFEERFLKCYKHNYIMKGNTSDENGGSTGNNSEIDWSDEGVLHDNETGDYPADLPETIAE